MSNQVSRHVRRVLMISALGLAAAGTMSTMAADAAADSELDEVIVTAQNRAQDVNDVPIAIDVVSAEALRDSGFASMNDISQIAPVVQLNQDQGAVKVTVRGVGTNSNDEAQDTSVVVNIDGEYINRPNVMSVALFDMERVEVLRGPQGTLYGRNSTGGAINFVTRKPGRELGANASVSYGNFDALHVDAGIDIPLGDVAAVRLAVFKDKHDGYVKHPGVGASDTNDAKGARLSAHIDATDALSFDLAAEMARRQFTPGAYAAANLNAAGVGPAGPGCNAAGFVRVPVVGYTQTLCVPSGTNFLSSINRGSFTAPLFGLGEVGQDTHAFRAKMAYEISPSATLTYTGGLRRYFGDPDGFLTLPIVYRSFSFHDVADTQSHELRLNGEANGVVYQVGAFYFKEDLDRESGFFLPIGGANGTFLSYFGRNVESKSRSLFGQIELPFAEHFTAVAGLRYTDSDRQAIYRNASPFGAGPPDQFLGNPARSTATYLFNSGPGRKTITALPYLSTLNLNPAKEDKITWLAGINYKPDADTLVYGKVSTGFKAGGFDSVGSYKPETNTALEAGVKKTLDGGHQVNFGAFYYDYKDLQVSVLLDTTIGGQTFNAGKARIWGLEASGDFKLSENDRFRVSANYLNSEYKELLAQFNVFCVACGGAGQPADVNGIGDLNLTQAGVQQPNFAGNRTPFSPKFILTAGLDHVFPLGSAGSLTLSADATFKTSYFLDFYNYNDGRQKSLTQADVTLDYKPEQGNYSVQAYAKNVGNKRPLTYGSFVSAGPDDIFNWQFGPPRTYGLRVNVDF